MLRSAHRLLALAWIAAAATACGDKSPADPPGEVFPPGIGFPEGNNATDTIGTVQATQLLITVRTHSGDLAPNAVVFVEGMPYSTGDSGVEMQAGLPTEAGFADGVRGVTDLRGTLRVKVRMGNRTGPARLVVRAPDLGVADTARYTVLPGAAVRVQSVPQDTVVRMGSRVLLRTAAYDRHGNARSGDAAVVEVASGPGTAAGNELVTGASIGTIAAAARVGSLRDTSIVRVVPDGTVASATKGPSGYGAALYTFSLDGSGIRRVQTSVTGPGYSGEMSVAWLTPTRLVYHDNNWNHTRQLYVLDLATGTSARFLPQPPQFETENFPRASRDGSWVYFAGGLSYRYGVYRARADGSGVEQISPAADPYNEWGADPSPDGTQIVFVKDGNNFGEERLYRMDLGSRTVTPLNRKGASPRWSPDGSRIAYADPSVSGAPRIAVMNADGTDPRILGAAGIYGDLSWSPDGKYIIAATLYVNQLVIIDAATGAEVTINYPAIVEGLKSPVWKP